jgi:hypothetical protein
MRYLYCRSQFVSNRNLTQVNDLAIQLNISLHQWVTLCMDGAIWRLYDSRKPRWLDIITLINSHILGTTFIFESDAPICFCRLYLCSSHSLVFRWYSCFIEKLSNIIPDCKQALSVQILLVLIRMWENLSEECRRSEVSPQVHCVMYLGSLFTNKNWPPSCTCNWKLLSMAKNTK